MKRSLPSQLAADSSAAKKPRTVDEDSAIDDEDLIAAVPCETQAALQLITSTFPSAGHLGGAVPPLALKHQLYAIVNDRTMVDRQLIELSRRGTVQLFHLTTGSSEYAVAFQSHYKRHVADRCAKHDGETDVDALVEKLLDGCRGEVTVSRHLLKEELAMSESEITLLVSIGVLTMCNVNAWYMAIPNASIFVKALTRGRQLVLRAIRSQRHNEILQTELEQRRMPGALLGVGYHIYDLKGGDYVTTMQTTSGDLLRLSADVLKKKKR